MRYHCKRLQATLTAYQLSLVAFVIPNMARNDDMEQGGKKEE